MCDKVLEKLKELDIDIKNCRGQSYDNAANMSGKYAGLQRKIKDVNNLIDYIPCAAHSLNLVGVHSVSCCLEAIHFFGLLNSLYTFCSGSTHRWAVLTKGFTPNENNRILTLKHLSNTRWSCHAEATKALCQNYRSLYENLKDFVANEDEPESMKSEANGLITGLEKLETGFMAKMWNRILIRFNSVSLILQKECVDLLTATSLLESLEEFTEQLRSKFDEIEDDAKNIMPCISQHYQYEVKRLRK